MRRGVRLYRKLSHGSQTLTKSLVFAGASTLDGLFRVNESRGMSVLYDRENRFGRPKGFIVRLVLQDSRRPRPGAAPLLL
jgi:hypothetical protein